MYVCSCFGITEQQVREHAGSGACTPRRIASACKAGTDCGGCVRRIQSLLGRGTWAPGDEPVGPSRPSALDSGAVPGPATASGVPAAEPVPAAMPAAPVPAAEPVPAVPVPAGASAWESVRAAAAAIPAAAEAA